MLSKASPMYHGAIMKFSSALVLLSAIPALAQTATHHSGTTAHRAAPACAKVPEISSKIPALPAGTGCPKVMYTITTTPAVKLDYVSPLEGPDFAEKLGIESTSFTLAYADIKTGTGEAAAPHKFYSIQYTGWLTDGTKFDSSVERNEPFTIEYGKHQVIPGWDTGFAGMHVGGKRRLFIPFQLAYGPNGKGSQIPPKSELIFDVELVAVSDTPPAPKTPPTMKIAPPPAKTTAPTGTTAPPATAPLQPGSADSVVGKPTATPPPANPTVDPTKPTTATPPKP